MKVIVIGALLLLCSGLAQSNNTSSRHHPKFQAKQYPIPRRLTGLAAEANKLLKVSPTINDNRLLSILEKCEKSDIVNKAGKLVWNFWESTTDLRDNRTSPFESFDEFEKNTPGFFADFKTQMQFRDFDFTPISELLEGLARMTPEGQQQFMQKISTFSIVHEFLKGVMKIPKSLTCYRRLTKTLLPHLQYSTAEYFLTLVESLETWKTLAAPSKSFIKSSISKGNPMDCLNVWNERNASDEKSKMVRMIESMDSVMGMDSCFWKVRTLSHPTSNIQPSPKEFEVVNFGKSFENLIPELSQYFTRTPVLEHGDLIDVLESAESDNVIDKIGLFVLAVWDLQNQTNTSPTDVFNVFDEYQKIVPHLTHRFKTAVLSVRNFDFKYIRSTVQQFRQLDVEKAEKFLKTLEDSHNYRAISPSLFRFFSKIRSLKDPEYWLKRWEEELIRHTTWSPASLFEDLASSVRTWESIGGSTRKKLIGMFGNRVNPVKCYEKYRQWMQSESSILAMVKFLDDSIGTTSCLKKIQHKILNTNKSGQSHMSTIKKVDLSSKDFSIKNLNQFWESNQLLKEGSLIRVLQEAESKDLINQIGISVIDFWKMSDGKFSGDVFATIDQYNTAISLFPYHFEMLTVDFESLHFDSIAAVLKQYSEMSSSRKIEFFNFLRSHFDHLDSAKAMFDCFKTFDTIPDGLKHVERLGYTLLHQVHETKNRQFYEGVANVIFSWNGLTSTQKDDARKLVDTKTTAIQCHDILSKPTSASVVDMLGLMESLLNVSVCFSGSSYLKHKSVAFLFQHGVLIKYMQLFENNRDVLNRTSTFLRKLGSSTSFIKDLDTVKQHDLLEIQDSVLFGEVVRKATSTLKEILTVSKSSAENRKKFILNFTASIGSEIEKFMRYENLEIFMKAIENFVKDIQNVGLIRCQKLIGVYENFRLKVVQL